MLVALLKRKLNREFKRPACEIEDLLTSVVFGSCQYAHPQEVLLPFLGMARNEQGLPLADRIRDVVSVEEYEFWPTWTKNARSPSCEANASEQADDQAEPDHAGGSPELLLKLSRSGSTIPTWILVEAKLYSGKSSEATVGSAGPVTDQLGKYWLELRERAKRANAEALAVVYVTRGSLIPREEFRDTQQELHNKGLGDAPLFWLSWGHFIKACPQLIDKGAPTHRLLRDVVDLLRNFWFLEHVEMATWPDPPMATPAWDFSVRWSWPLAEHLNLRWHFWPDWSWPVALGELPAWLFNNTGST